MKVHDCYGNNCAVACATCGGIYVVSKFLNKGEPRRCPDCGHAGPTFDEAKTVWDREHVGSRVAAEQSATRLTFRKAWLGQDVWVTFVEDGIKYRYPHDQILQILITQLGVIKGTRSWERDNGYYNFPRLSADQKRILKPYIVTP